METKYKYLDDFYTVSEIVALNNNEFYRGSLIRRLNKGQTAEEAVKEIMQTKKSREPLNINNNEVSKSQFAASNNISGSTLSSSEYKETNPLEALKKIKENKPISYPYQNQNDETIYLTIMEAAKRFKIDYTTIRRYILQGFSMNEAIHNAKNNQIEILSVPPLNDIELNNQNMNNLNSIKDRLRKFCISKRISNRFIYYLVKEKGYSINEAIDKYNQNGRNGPNKWQYVVNDILLNSFCIKYRLDDKQFIDYLKASNNDFILTLEKSVFLNIFYTDFDLSPRNRAELFKIYLEMKEMNEFSKLEYFKQAIRKKMKMERYY